MKLCRAHDCHRCRSFALVETNNTSNAIKQARTSELNTLIEQYANEHASPSSLHRCESSPVLGSGNPAVGRRVMILGMACTFLLQANQRLASLIASAIEELRPGANHAAFRNRAR